MTIPTITASNGVTLARVGVVASVDQIDLRLAANDNDDAPDAGRNSCPMAEAFSQGLFDDRYRLAVRWWHRHHSGREFSEVRGSSYNNSGGNPVPFICRDPEALFAQEWAAEVSLACEKVYRLLGKPLVAIVDAAMQHAEMADLAPRLHTFPKEKRAKAGRIWLGAAFEIICLFAEDGRLSPVVADRIKHAADDAVMALVAKRKLRAANDNLKYAAVA